MKTCKSKIIELNDEQTAEIIELIGDFLERNFSPEAISNSRVTIEIQPISQDNELNFEFSRTTMGCVSGLPPSSRCTDNLGWGKINF